MPHVVGDEQAVVGDKFREEEKKAVEWSKKRNATVRQVTSEAHKAANTPSGRRVVIAATQRVQSIKRSGTANERIESVGSIVREKQR